MAAAVINVDDDDDDGGGEQDLQEDAHTEVKKSSKTQSLTNKKRGTLQGCSQQPTEA